MSNDNSYFEELTGEQGPVLRFTMGAPAPTQEQTRAADDIRVISERQSSGDPVHVPTVDVIGTARSPMGAVSGREVSEKSLVTVGGMEMTIAQAEKINAVRFDEVEKRWVNTSGQAIRDAVTDKPEPETQFQKDQGHPEPLNDKKAEAFLYYARESGSQIELESMVNDFLEGNEPNQESINRMAGNIGAEPHVIQELIDHTIGVFTKAATDSIEMVFPGAGDAVMLWASENKPAELKAAMKQHWLTQRTDGYKPFAMSYIVDRSKNDADGLIRDLKLGSPDMGFRQESGRIIVTFPNGYQRELISGFLDGTFPSRS